MEYLSALVELEEGVDRCEDSADKSFEVLRAVDKFLRLSGPSAISTKCVHYLHGKHTKFIGSDEN